MQLIVQPILVKITAFVRKILVCVFFSLIVYYKFVKIRLFWWIDGSFKCICPANFYGVNCQVQVTSATCNLSDTDINMCSTLSTLGYCKFIYSFDSIPIPIYCPRSCQACTKISLCSDIQTNCAQISLSGQCSSLNSTNPNACKKSCGLCGNIPWQKKTFTTVNF